MTKESSQIFTIDLFVKEAYHVMKISHKYNGFHGKNSLLSEAVLIISLKKRLFETSFGSDIPASFTVCRCQGTNTFGSI